MASGPGYFPSSNTSAAGTPPVSAGKNPAADPSNPVNTATPPSTYNNITSSLPGQMFGGATQAQGSGILSNKQAYNLGNATSTASPYSTDYNPATPAPPSYPSTVSTAPIPYNNPSMDPSNGVWSPDIKPTYQPGQTGDYLGSYGGNYYGTGVIPSASNQMGTSPTPFLDTGAASGGSNPSGGSSNGLVNKQAAYVDNSPSAQWVTQYSGNPQAALQSFMNLPPLQQMQFATSNPQVQRLLFAGGMSQAQFNAFVNNNDARDPGGNPFAPQSTLNSLLGINNFGGASVANAAFAPGSIIGGNTVGSAANNPATPLPGSAAALANLGGLFGTTPLSGPITRPDRQLPLVRSNTPYSPYSRPGTGNVVQPVGWR